MTEEKIARINALAHKAKVESLTPEELAERDKLRRIYIDSIKANLTYNIPHAANYIWCICPVSRVNNIQCTSPPYFFGILIVEPGFNLYPCCRLLFAL